MNIHQLSLNHDVLQDRLLLRINTTAKEELRIWLTRRLALGLQPHLERLGLEAMTPKAAMETPVQTEQARQMMAEFKQQENLSKADFATPYAEADSLPLGAEPLLITDIQMSPQTDGSILLGFQEKLGPAPHRGFQARVKSDLIVGLQHLLRDAIAKAEWLSGTSPVQAKVEPAAEPPSRGYLN
ncbi:MAG: hypothetical protein FGM44_03235 [Limnohabitans sp.]|jgi:hypothetical protein|nr:hypothetical protein [Limnohabitans sp.]